MAKFTTGESGNPNGRPKGAVNVVTKQLRFKLKNLIDAELENLPGLLDGLEPKDRVELLVKLMAYAMPKVQPICSSANEPLDFELDEL